MPEIKLVPTYMLRPLAGAHDTCPISLGKVKIGVIWHCCLPPLSLVNFKPFPGSSVSPGEEALLCQPTETAAFGDNYRIRVWLPISLEAW